MARKCMINGRTVTPNVCLGQSFSPTALKWSPRSLLFSQEKTNCGETYFCIASLLNKEKLLSSKIVHYNSAKFVRFYWLNRSATKIAILVWPRISMHLSIYRAFRRGKVTRKLTTVNRNTAFPYFHLAQAILEINRAITSRNYGPMNFSTRHCNARRDRARASFWLDKRSGNHLCASTKNLPKKTIVFLSVMQPWCQGFFFSLEEGRATKLLGGYLIVG